MTRMTVGKWSIRGIACAIALIAVAGAGLTAATAGTARAQEGEAPAGEDAAKPEEGKAKPEDAKAAAQEAAVEVAPDSPRASLLAYLILCRDGKYEQAALYLDLPADQLADGARTAKRLKVVLDNHLWFDLDKISPLSVGDLNDKLPPNIEELGVVPGPDGKSEPVRMVKRDGEGGGRWVFNAATVGRVDEWYRALGGTWLREYLPDFFFRYGPRELQWWQWAALPVLLLVAYLASMFLAAGTKIVLGRIFSRTKTTLDDEILKRIRAPLRFAWALGVIYVLLPSLGLVAPAHKFALQILAAGVFFVVFWAILRSADIVGEVILKSPWAITNPQARPLLSLAIRAGKVVILIMGLIGVLAEMGYPVGSMLATLGIGGLAFALAAQKTIENVFGSVSIGMDQPMREGEFVRIDDFVGTVEAIGLRSSRFRTLDRTLITIPNGKLADMKVETFAARDRIRLATSIGLVYSTTAEQMRKILADLEKVLRAHPKCWQEAVVVRFKEFGASSLDIEIMVWFTTKDYAEFTLIKQEILLQMMKVVQENGSSFAFPSRSIYMEKSA